MQRGRGRGASVPSLIMISAVLLCAAVSCAPYPYPPPDVQSDPLRGIEYFSRALNLSDDQLRAIAKIRDDLRKEDLKNRAELQAAMIDLRELTHQPKKDLDEEKILKKVDEIGAIETKMRADTVRAGLSMANVLTDEQYTRFGDFLSGPPSDY